MFEGTMGGANARNYLRGLLLPLTLGLLGGLSLRYAILENVTWAQVCLAHGQDLSCQVRAALGWSIYIQLFGLGALGLALLAWLRPLRRLSWPALLLSAGGLLLYNTSYAAIALIVAMLAALRE